jgi:hypothetical protein
VWNAIRAAEAGNPPPVWRTPPAVFDTATGPEENEAAEAVDI